jgi:type III secretion protein T
MADPLQPPSFEQIKLWLWSLLIVQARVAPLFLLLPFMNRALVPRPISIGLAAGLGLVAVPAVNITADTVPEITLLFGLVLKESLIGFTLGFLLAIPFWIFETVGFIIDNQRGASMGATLNPLTGHDSSPLGQLFSLAFIVYFLTAGGATVLLGILYDSYRLWHPLQFWPTLSPEFADLIMAQLNRLIGLGLLLAAPVLVAMFLAELGLALVSRFAPQLQVFFLAMPIKSALALLILAIYASTLFDYAAPELRLGSTWVNQLNPLLQPSGR